MLLQLLFRCVHCSEPAEPSSFPLCELCLESLIPAPALCAACASPRCPARGAGCIRPWAGLSAAESGVRSFAARYFLAGRSYALLRRWKTNHGSLFDRRILKADVRSRALWRATGAQRIVPVPQTPDRAWILGGSPALAIAGWVGRETGLTVVPNALALPRGHLQRQAELNLEGRLMRRLSVEAGRDARAIEGKIVLLVDDFLTSAHTTLACADALTRLCGARSVHVFCLGARPRLEMTGAQDGVSGDGVVAGSSNSGGTATGDAST